jgi:DNA-binding MarR family transcriptional regulator
MDTQELRTLKLFEEIENEHAPSQRDLATRLNISLGLVNSFMKRLTQKGYFKITNIPKNRVRYILTPKGAAEKTRLTYEYIQYSFQFYKEARRKLRKIFKQFEKQKIKDVVFWGTGELAEIAYISLQETQLNLVAVVDAKRAGENFLGQGIIKPQEILLKSNARIVVTAIDSTGDAMKAILGLGIPRDKISFLS